jgi:hypothetical protein
MEPKVSLPCSQTSANIQYPQPDTSSPHLPYLSPRVHFNNIFPSTPKSSKWSLPFYFPDQNFVMYFSSLPIIYNNRLNYTYIYFILKVFR